MKQLITFLLILSFNSIFSQDYFEGKKLYCKSENPEAIRLFNIGIETLHLNYTLDEKYLKKTSAVFFNSYKADTTFCDALFFAGYTLRLLNDKKALAFYIMADSLSNNKSIEFKTNLAAEGLRYGTEKSITIARKKYIEAIKYFPESPEGYYGFAVTSLFYGDVEKGLENINTAIEKYKASNLEVKMDAVFMKGILLSLNKKYDEALLYLEISQNTYKKEENFNIYYSLCLLKVSESKNDEKMRQKAKKTYNKIKHKDEIPEDVKSLLKF